VTIAPAEPADPSSASAPPEPDAPSPGVHPKGVAILAACLVVVAAFPATRVLLKMMLVALPGLLVYLLSILLVSRLVGAKVAEFSLGYGGPAVFVRIGGVLVGLRWLPLGGFIRHPTSVSDDNTEDPTTDPALSGAVTPVDFRTRDAPVPFDRLHPLKRITLAMSGPVSSLLFAVMLLGGAGFSSFARGFGQYVGMAWRTREQNADLIRPFFVALDQNQWVYGIGTLAAKNAAGNMLPLTVTVGGMALLALLEWVRGKPLPKWLRSTLETLSIIALLAYLVFGVRAVWLVLQPI
jgi:membrane-associated protease RseP (regulator of RpoE activity)